MVPRIPPPRSPRTLRGHWGQIVVIVAGRRGWGSDQGDGELQRQSVGFRRPGWRSLVRYTETVENPFVQGIAGNFDSALRLMGAALADCPDELWETDLWPDEAPTAPTPHGGLHGSAPWFLAYHALSTLDYDLAAEFEPWIPPRPFDENSYAFPNRMFTKDELLGYLVYCRDRVSRTLDGLTEAAGSSASS